jgi:hypothetical protein
LSTCDARLLKISVPDSVSRVPKTLFDYMHWKGSELQAWVLYFSLPVLEGLLPVVYLRHWGLVVGALHILSSDAAELDTAEKLLLEFYKKFPELYSAEKCSMNVHILCHLTDCVKNWGPIWCYSCFAFETRNGDIKRLFHGSRDMSKQMAFSYIWMQVIPRAFVRTTVPQVQVVQNVLLGRKSIKKHPLGTVHIVGSTSTRTPTPEVAQLLQETGSITTFTRVLTNDNVIFYSKEYLRVKTRNSYTVAFRDGRNVMFGQILYFVALNNQAIAIIDVLNPGSAESTFQLTFSALNLRVFPVSSTTRVLAVPVTDIQEKCIFVSVGLSTNFVARFTSQVHLD